MTSVCYQRICCRTVFLLLPSMMDSHLASISSQHPDDSHSNLSSSHPTMSAAHSLLRLKENTILDASNDVDASGDFASPRNKHRTPLKMKHMHKRHQVSMMNNMHYWLYWYLDSDSGSGWNSATWNHVATKENNWYPYGRCGWRYFLYFVWSLILIVLEEECPYFAGQDDGDVNVEQNTLKPCRKMDVQCMYKSHHW